MNKNAKLKISIEGKKHNIDVMAGETLLQACLDKSLDIPYSCSTGNCGACQARLISGQVDMPEETFLTIDEVKDNLILLCQCLALTETVEVIIED